MQRVGGVSLHLLPQAAHIIYLSRSEAIAASLLAQEVPHTVIAAALTSTEISEMQRVGGVSLHLLPQAAHINRQGVAVHIISGVVPQLAEDGCISVCIVGMGMLLSSIQMNLAKDIYLTWANI